ncbi:MAG: ArsC/Spx/MgsR family protein [Methylomonas sp.]|jgi:nitrogenase-associated protein
MATVHFYEKPGCINNTRQKQLLIKAGHELLVFDLLQQAWNENPGKLRSFFGDTPVADWFNRSAPAVKNGEIIPEAVNEQQAIALMIADPILIRRPLLEAGGRRRAGFDPLTVETWLGLAADSRSADLETCPNNKPDKPACRP